MKKYILKALNAVIRKLSSWMLQYSGGAKPVIEFNAANDQPVICKGSKGRNNIFAPRSTVILDSDCDFEGEIVAKAVQSHGYFRGRIVTCEAVFFRKGDIVDSIIFKPTFKAGSEISGDIVFDPRYLVVEEGAVVRAELIGTTKIDLAAYGILQTESREIPQEKSLVAPAAREMSAKSGESGNGRDEGLTMGQGEHASSASGSPVESERDEFNRLLEEGMNEAPKISFKEGTSGNPLDTIPEPSPSEFERGSKD